MSMLGTGRCLVLELLFKVVYGNKIRSPKIGVKPPNSGESPPDKVLTLKKGVRALKCGESSKQKNIGFEVSI